MGLDHTYCNGIMKYFCLRTNQRTRPDSKETTNGTLTENRTAVTTRYLIEKTAEIQKKRLSNKEMLETLFESITQS